MMKGASFAAACRCCRSAQRLSVRSKIHTRTLQIGPWTLEPSFTDGKLRFPSTSLEHRASRTFANTPGLRNNKTKQTPTIRTSEKILDDLKPKIQQWLQVPVGAWKAQQIVQGQYLLDKCLKDGSETGIQWATRILSRWIQERQDQNHITIGPELVELLHRVLHGWKLVGSHFNAEGNINFKSILELLENLEDACAQGQDVPKSHQPGNKAYSMIFQLLALQAQDPDTLETTQKLLERRLRKGGVVDLLLWQSCLNTMAQCSPFHNDAATIAEATLQQMSVAPDQVCFASVLHAWATSKRPGAAQRAQAILDGMLSSNSPVEPNNVCINTCINAWAKSGEADGPQHAQDLLRRMEVASRQSGKQHLAPDSVAYSTVVHAWAKSADPRAAHYAEHIFNNMQRMSENGNEMMQPDQRTCGSVLDAWARSPEPGAAARAEALLERIEELYRQGKLKVQPSKPMYSSVMNAWANSRDEDAPEKAERFLMRTEDTKHGDVALGTIGYTTAIQAWARSSRQDSATRALAILRRMQHLQRDGRVDVAPNSMTFNTAITACATRGEVKLALDLLEEMHTRTEVGEPNVQPDTVTYASCINACAKAGSPKQAMILLDEMEALFESGNDMVRPNTIAYTSAIAAWEGCGACDAGDQAESILWRMWRRYEGGNEDAKPNGKTVSAAMRVWSSSGEAQAPEKVEALLAWMHDQYETGNDSLRPRTVHYNHVLETWAKSRRFDATIRIKDVLKDMWEDPSSDARPNRDSYTMLLLSIHNSSDRHRAAQCFEVLQDMITSYRNGNAAMKPSRRTFHLVLSACSGTATNGQHERDSAATVVRETVHILTSTDEWGEPNAFTCNLLKDACKALSDSIDDSLVNEIHSYCEPSGDTQDRGERRKFFWHV